LKYDNPGERQLKAKHREDRQGYIAKYASVGHLSGSLGKACSQTKKGVRKIKGKGLGIQPQKRRH
jgi:hypothetical protein